MIPQSGGNLGIGMLPPRPITSPGRSRTGTPQATPKSQATSDRLIAAAQAKRARRAERKQSLMGRWFLNHIDGIRRRIDPLCEVWR